MRRAPVAPATQAAECMSIVFANRESTIALPRVRPVTRCARQHVGSGSNFPVKLATSARRLHPNKQHIRTTTPQRGIGGNCAAPRTSSTTPLLCSLIEFSWCIGRPTIELTHESQDVRQQRRRVVAPIGHDDRRDDIWFAQVEIDDIVTAEPAH